MCDCMKYKMNLKAEDSLWNEVLKVRIDLKLKNNNEAVMHLIKRGLRSMGRPTGEKFK